MRMLFIFATIMLTGFKFLTLEQKVDVLDRVDGDLIAQFLVDNPIVRIVDLSGGRLEDGIGWVDAVAGELVVTKEICQGAMLMQSPCIRLPLLEDGSDGSGSASLQESMFIICKLDNSYKLLLQSQQCITSGSMLVGLFCFMKNATERSEQTPSNVDCILSTTKVGGIQMCEVYATRNLQPHESLYYVI